MTESRIRGTVLLGLLASRDADERSVGVDVVREAIAHHGSTVSAGEALGISPRTVQRLCRAEETKGLEMRATARRRGRPKKARPVAPASAPTTDQV